MKKIGKNKEKLKQPSIVTSAQETCKLKGAILVNKRKDALKDSINSIISPRKDDASNKNAVISGSSDDSLDDLMSEICDESYDIESLKLSIPKINVKHIKFSNIVLERGAQGIVTKG